MYTTDFLDIPPLTQAGGSLRLPGSKSISNRALLMAALCQQPTTITNLLLAEDTQVMLQALQQLGCEFEQQGTQVQFKVGLLAALQRQTPLPPSLDLANAGTAFRSLTAVLALLGVPIQLTGIERMQQRPIADLVTALRQSGCKIEYLGQLGCPPLQIQPRQSDASVEALTVKGNISSQFLTALLMALPLVAEQDIRLSVEGELISKPYVDITLAMLAEFGINIRQADEQHFIIPAGAGYRSPGLFAVEPDASSASYFAAIGALAAQEQPIELLGLTKNALQGDVQFIQVLQQMGAQVQWQDTGVQIKRGAYPLQAIDLDCNHIPDAAMTLAVLALFANGTSTLRNIASWRVKETDRLTALAIELRKVGALVVEGEDYLQITAPTQWRSASLATYNDHRMAMSLALLAFNGAQQPMRINNPACVVKTYPDYFEDLFAVVSTMVQNIPVICIDGPTASGKGTLSTLVAQQLGYHYLDSGALYRLLALAALRQQVVPDDVAALVQLALTLPVQFKGQQILLAGEDVSDQIRAEQVGLLASKVAVHAPVRQALLQLQHSFRQLPGLVADGRDMGTLVFPQAQLKIFLTASAEQRAKRRYNQLKEKKISVRIRDLLQDLQDRDRRDSERLVAPLVPAPQAKLLDNSELSIAESVQWVLQQWQQVHGSVFC